MSVKVYDADSSHREFGYSVCVELGADSKKSKTYSLLQTYKEDGEIKSFTAIIDIGTADELRKELNGWYARTGHEQC